jgi:hypothetical protein
MEVVSTSEMMVIFYQTTWCNIPEDKPSSEMVLRYVDICERNILPLSSRLK